MAVVLRDHRDHVDPRKRFWNKPDSLYRNILNEAFENYISWRGNCKHIRVPEDRFYSGYIPGDFTATVEVKNFKLGVVGLNTAFFQLASGNYEHRLEIKPVQFAKASRNDSIDIIGNKKM